jgi:GNAT superfamily N-acetyltransferase
MIEVRAAVPGDGALLMLTTAELGSSHGWGAEMSTQALDFERDLFCDAPIIGALLAFVDGAFAGSALWHRSYATSRGREVMYLEDVAVLKEFRRMGVAEALLKEIAKVAVLRGYKKVFWLMMDWNTNARQLYEKVGAEIENGNCYCSLHDQALLDLAK